MRFSPGDSFDRYKIEALIGEGGMGEVYRAEDTRLGRKVALKMIRADESADSETWGRAVARMQREARAVAALSHPSIVAVFDVAEHDGIPYLAMELVEGKPLRELIGTDLSFDRRLGILLDVAKALSVAHQAGIVHRDIKPENILVSDRFAVKVLDFGIARFRPPSLQKSDTGGATAPLALATMTAEGTFLGTPAYMAPEQLRGEELDARADQFGWGVVAFELLAGKLPFRTDKGAISLMASILSDPTPPLPEEVPLWARELVGRALEKAPEDRFSSMEELVSAFEGAFGGDALSTNRTSRRQKVLPSVETKAATTGAAASANAPKRRLVLLAPVLLVLVALAIGVSYPRKATVEPAASPSSSVQSPPTPVATAVTDLPIPHSESAEAKLAFREGLQAIRDSSWESAMAGFDRARKADPSMVAAHMRFAIFGMFSDFPASQEAFRKAILGRASLSERDQAFLDAIAPVVQTVPSDYAAARPKFDALSIRYPGDAEIVFWRIRSLMQSFAASVDVEQVLALADACLKIDPKYADCVQMKVHVLERAGRFDEALAVAEQCIDVSVGASDCLDDKIRIAMRSGRCSGIVETARRWMLKDPKSAKPYEGLAAGLYFTGEQEATVRAAIEQAKKRYEALGQGYAAELLAMEGEIAFGNLDAAGKIARTLTLSGDMQLPEQGVRARRVWVTLLLEQGKREEAAKIADESLVSSVSGLGMRLGSNVFDSTVMFHATKLLAGKISKAQFEEQREKWIKAQPRDTRVQRYMIWREAYVWPALLFSSDETALLTEPEYVPVTDAMLERAEREIAFGRGVARMAAGKPKEAAPWLDKAAGGCAWLGDALERTQVLFLAGKARMANGDTKGACEAYSTLFSRWSKAKDSMTLKAVTKEMKAHCQGVR